MNNKLLIAIAIFVSLGVFAWLVDYGWRNRYGSPETYETTEPAVLTVGYNAEDLALKEEADIFAQVWQGLPALDVVLNQQVTEKPWPRGSTPAVQVQAFHNGKDVYFRMQWKDDRADTVVSVDSFVDGCAVAVPLATDQPPRSIMMGFNSPVNIWHWRANQNMQFWQGKTGLPTLDTDFIYPFEEEEIFSVSTPEVTTAVTDTLANKAGSLTRKKAQIVQGRGVWRDQTWTVVFKRALTTGDAEQDCQFSWANQAAAFAVWDGDQGDRGARKSMSEWVRLQPSKASAGKQAQAGNAHTAVSPISWIDKICSFSLIASAHAADSQQTPAEQQPRVINIQARRFEYNPNKISVKKGELITLRMESLDVTHGLYLDGYGINIKARPGLIGKATFVADKTGRFSFRCSETCGEFHPYMIGFFEVTPNTRFNLFVGVIGVVFMAILAFVLLGGRKETGDAHVGTEQ